MFYLDSSDPKEVEDLFKWGVLSGVTTNPLIISREMPGADLEETIKAILAVSTGPVSVELTEPTAMAMADEAERRWSWDWDRLCIKVPVNDLGLQVIRLLRTREKRYQKEGSRKELRINATCIMTPMQALLAAMAGADYVSLFWGRIADLQVNPAHVVRLTRESLSGRGYGKVEVIVGSIRQAGDVSCALSAGADIVTVPPQILRQLVHHPRTAETIREFNEAWEKQQASCKP